MINKWGMDEYTKYKIAKKGDDDYRDIYNIDESLEDIINDD